MLPVMDVAATDAQSLDLDPHLPGLDFICDRVEGWPFTTPQKMLYVPPFSKIRNTQPTWDRPFLVTQIVFAVKDGSVVHHLNRKRSQNEADGKSQFSCYNAESKEKMLQTHLERLS